MSCGDGSIPFCGRQFPSHHHLHKQKSQQTTGCIQSVHAVKRNSSPEEFWNTLHSCTKQCLGSPWLHKCSLTSWVDASQVLVLCYSGMTSVVKAQIETQGFSPVEETSIEVRFLLPQCQTLLCARSMPCHTRELPISLRTWFVLNSQRKIFSLFLPQSAVMLVHRVTNSIDSVPRAPSSCASKI